MISHTQLGGARMESRQPKSEFMNTILIVMYQQILRSIVVMQDLAMQIALDKGSIRFVRVNGAVHGQQVQAV